MVTPQPPSTAASTMTPGTLPRMAAAPGSMAPPGKQSSRARVPPTRAGERDLTFRRRVRSLPAFAEEGNMRRTVVAMAVLLLVGPAAGAGPGDTVATVGSQTITRTQLETQMRAKLIEL